MYVKVLTGTSLDNVPVDGDAAGLDAKVFSLEWLFGEDSLEISLECLDLSRGKCVSASATNDGGVDGYCKCRGGTEEESEGSCEHLEDPEG